jgi:hypothetical protein
MTTSETSNSARNKAPMLPSSAQQEQAVHSLNSRDVVLGRGQHVKHKGNTHFLQLVRSRAAEYHACTSKTSKDGIARQIVRVVEDSGGRFVKGSETRTTAATTVPVWVVADQAAVKIKVKQTFRDYSVVRRKAAAAASFLASTLPVSQATSAPPLADTGHHPGELHMQSSIPVDRSEVASAPSTSVLGTQNVTPLHNQLLERLGLADISLSTLASPFPLQQQLSNHAYAAVQLGSAAQSAPSLFYSDASHSRLNEIIQSLVQQELVRQLQANLTPQSSNHNSHNLITGLAWQVRSNPEMPQSLHISQPQVELSQLGGVYPVPPAMLPLSSYAPPPLPLSHLQVATVLGGWNSVQGSLTPADDVLLETSQCIHAPSAAAQPHIQDSLGSRAV